ncbi:MAG: flagellar basal body rod protein FlgB [Proteobacteria bacterium]|nr:MAG: flagellar basal body rod protein FlgB [Pseudomonadota bacterium]
MPIALHFVAVVYTTTKTDTMSLIDRIFERTYPGLMKAMDLTHRRNEAITSNIANAETPGYRAVDLNFAGELDRAFGEQKSTLKLSNAKHLDTSSNGAAHLVPDYSGATKPDGNNVDIDIQMGQMAINSGGYSRAAAMLRKKLAILKLAIREGGR